MKRFLLIWLLLLISDVLMAAVPGFGGTLTFQSRTTLTILTDRLSVEIFAQNLGNETAHDVQAYLHVFGKAYPSDAVESMEAGQSRVFQLTVPLAPGLKGEFAFVGEVVFHDADRLPSSALSGSTFRLGSLIDSTLSAHAAQVNLVENERLSVTVVSRDSMPRDVAATVYLPRTLTTFAKTQTVTIDPLQTATIDFPVFQRFDIGGANYPVFCTVSYEADGIARAAFVQTAVTVKAKRNWFIQTRWYWLAGGVFNVFAWVAVWKRRKK